METETRDDGEISIIALLTTLVRNWWKIAAWALVIGFVAAVNAKNRPVVYLATATFSSVGAAAPPSGLAGLAGQLGLTGGGSGGSSPAFYVMLAQSPVLLSKLVRDTFVVAERGGKAMTVYEVLNVKGVDSVRREEAAMNAVKGLISTDVQKGTGFLQINAATPWPSFSKSLVISVLGALEHYNVESRRGAAAVERKFIEGRMADALADLRQAEDQLQRFLAANREFTPTSVLAFQRDGLNRAVQLKQQVYTTLATNYEDARIREVRDTPVINVVEPPRVKLDPEPRKLIQHTAIGILIGALVGLVLTLIFDAAGRLARNRRDEAAELAASVRGIGDSLLRAVRLKR